MSEKKPSALSVSRWIIIGGFVVWGISMWVIYKNLDQSHNWDHTDGWNIVKWMTGILMIMSYAYILADPKERRMLTERLPVIIYSGVFCGFYFCS